MRAQPTLNKIVIQPPAPLLSIFFISHLFRSERIISLGAVVIVTSSFLLSFSHSDPFCANSKSSPRYLDSLLLIFVLNKLVPSQWALVVAQLVEQSFPAPKRSPVRIWPVFILIKKLYTVYFKVNVAKFDQSQ